MPQREIGDARRASVGPGPVCVSPVAENQGELRVLQSVMTRGMEELAVKKKEISRREVDLPGFGEQGLALGMVVAQKAVLIECAVVQRLAVAAGDDLKGSVVSGFLSEGQPRGDEIFLLIVPIPDILVPARLAGVFRHFGHDAVVMVLGKPQLRAACPNKVLECAMQGLAQGPGAKAGVSPKGVA